MQDSGCTEVKHLNTNLSADLSLHKSAQGYAVEPVENVVKFPENFIQQNHSWKRSLLS